MVLTRHHGGQVQALVIQAQVVGQSGNGGWSPVPDPDQGSPGSGTDPDQGHSVVDPDQAPGAWSDPDQPGSAWLV